MLAVALSCTRLSEVYASQLGLSAGVAMRGSSILMAFGLAAVGLPARAEVPAAKGPALKEPGRVLPGMRNAALVNTQHTDAHIANAPFAVGGGLAALSAALFILNDRGSNAWRTLAGWCRLGDGSCL